MHEPDIKLLATGGADSAQILDLVHQGLLPLPLKSILGARLVCQQWRHSIGRLITQLTLPYDVWCNSGSAAASPAAAANQLQPSPQPLQPAAAFPSNSNEQGNSQSSNQQASDGADREPELNIDRDDATWDPPTPTKLLMAQRRQRGQQQLDITKALTASTAQPATGQLAAMGAGGGLVHAAAAAAAVAAHGPTLQHKHIMSSLSSSLPSVRNVTLLCRSRGSQPPSQQAVITSLQVLGQLPNLTTLRLQGSMPTAMLKPMLSGLQQQQLQNKLAILQLVGVDLPQPHVLEGLMGLHSLQEFTLHASIKSPLLEVAHLDALATGSQLKSLSLHVHQVAGIRCRLDALLQLTQLKHLDTAYKGIFNDQRPVLSSASAISVLQHLISLASAGLASPFVPHPALTALHSLSATGLNRQLQESSVQQLSECSSIRQLRLEAGKRGAAAVPADKLHHLGAMSQVTSLSMALSKGGLSAGKTAQQLLQLYKLRGLKSLALSADHRLKLGTELLQQLAQQWPNIMSLRVSSFSALNGFTGFGHFTGLASLSLKPGVGTGKLLLELKEGLQPLQRLQRLHLDFWSYLRLEHVEAIAEACSNRLQHLSLNMRASNIGSKAIVSISRLSCLASLQLLNTTAATLSGPPAIAALQSMRSLRWLCVQAPEETLSQQPLELGVYVGDGVQGLEGLNELRVWLGSGAEARQAGEHLWRRVAEGLPGCRCVLLHEPDKPML